MAFFNVAVTHLPRYFLYYGILFGLFLADIQILPLFLELNVLSVFTLGAIYYWSIYRPDLLPAWLLFLLGFLKDLLTGLPLTGLSALLFISVQIMVKPQRSFLAGQSFFMIWAGYILMSAFSCFLFWAGLCLYTLHRAATGPFMIEAFVMTLSFPLLLVMMTILHRFLPFATPDKGSL
ncbi:MAG: hypothetical protein H6855_05500 [Rhodospirillales bacterium]|nr:hypothetical protein [Rhodospirillales bacterium]